MLVSLLRHELAMDAQSPTTILIRPHARFDGSRMREVTAPGVRRVPVQRKPLSPERECALRVCG
jgi:hypothetical protein